MARIIASAGVRPGSLLTGLRHPLSRILLVAAGVSAFCGAAAVAASWLWGADSLLDAWFKFVGGPFLCACAVIEAHAAFSVRSRYSAGEPMRAAWGLLAAAALVHLLSYLGMHIVGLDIAGNPIRQLPYSAAWMRQAQEFGRMLGGSLFPLLMVAGLGLVLRLYRRLGLMARLTLLDTALLTLPAAFVAFQFGQLARWVLSGQVRTSLMWSIDWATDPLYAILFLEAVLIRRANLPLRGGLLARCWSAYVAAIGLTTAGNLFLALLHGGYIPSQWMWPSWLVWHPAAALFALAPVFQLETIEHAFRRRD